MTRKLFRALIPAGAGIAAALVFISFHASGQDGPWNHRVLLARSQDGLHWTLDPEGLIERASVPELFLGPDGRLILLFVDANGPNERIGAMLQDWDGSWTRVETNLRGVDPNVVRLNDGSYRAYVKTGLMGAIAAYASEDGLRWRELGEVFQSPQYPQVTDPDVFETPEGWVMLLSLGPRLLRCTSQDGLHFITDGTLLDLGGSVSDTVPVPGGWRTFFHVNADPKTGARMRIRWGDPAGGPNPHAIHVAVSGDGIRFQEIGPAFQYPDLVDPDVFRYRGEWWMYVFARAAAQVKLSASSAVGDNTVRCWSSPGTAPQGR